MPIYEYAFGVYVEAEDKQAAWEIVRPISEALDAIDAEGDSAVDGPLPVNPDKDFGPSRIRELRTARVAKEAS